MNDETQPPFAEAELADPDLLPDIPSASVSWMLEYENRLAHVNAFVQARQAKAAQAAQPQQAGPKRGRGRPRKHGPLHSPAVLHAAKMAQKRKEREQAAAQQQAGPKRGRGRPRQHGPLPSPAMLRAAKTAQTRKQREQAAAPLTEVQLTAKRAEEAAARKKRRQKIVEKLSGAEITERKAKAVEQTTAWKMRRREKVKALLAECQRLLEDN